MSSRRAVIVLPLVGLSVLVYALMAAATLYTGVFGDGGVAWNLFLAWIPFIIAVAVYDGYRRGANRALLVSGGVLWLLFFPNAPYLTTDLKYLRGLEGLSFKYEVVLLSTAATVGLALGFASLYLMQTVVRQWRGPAAGWAFAVVAIGLGSLGIYLGRFLRLNSWDALEHPSVLPRIAHAVARDPFAYQEAIMVTALFTLALTFAYFLLYTLAAVGFELDTER